MCGILLMRSSGQLPTVTDRVRALLDSRGPQLSVVFEDARTLLIQSVLNTTGSMEFYHRDRPDGFAYNGQIYNFKSFGNFDTDTELAYRSAQQDPSKFRQFEGAWAWVYVNGDDVRYASDAQGERCLFRYQDQDLLIVSSEVAVILEIISCAIDIAPYSEKHWPVHVGTPWSGIQRVPAGFMCDWHQRSTLLDSVFSWKRPPVPMTWQDAVCEFDLIWQDVMSQMTPDEPAALTFSGGLDTGIIAASLPDAHFYTALIPEKDPVARQAYEMLDSAQLSRYHPLAMDEQTWAKAMVQLIQRTRMPAQSWSFVGQWHIAQHCEQRILFSGIGADELFGGYEIYQHLAYCQEHSASPYSTFDPDDCDPVVRQRWSQCLDFYDGDSGPATLLMDYLSQIAAVDMRGVDACTYAHGREPRAPFCHPRMVKFALNLPWNFRVTDRAKPLILDKYIKHWGAHAVKPKHGFAGHCNDSYQWLGIDVARSNDRARDWKTINEASFVRWAKHPNQTTPEQIQNPAGHCKTL